MKRLIRKAAHKYKEVTLKDVIKEAGGEQFLKSNYKYVEEVFPILLDAHERVMDKLFEKGADEVGHCDDTKMYDWANNRFDSDSYISQDNVIEKIGGEDVLRSKCKTLEQAEEYMNQIAQQIKKEKEQKYPGEYITLTENWDYETEQWLLQHGYQYEN